MKQSVTIFGQVFKTPGNEFDFLKETLKNIGIDVTEKDNMIHFSWDYFEVCKKQKRNAGVRKKALANVKGSSTTLSEVEALIAKLGTDETAKKLGISRATLFRRLKQSRSDRDLFEDDPYF